MHPNFICISGAEARCLDAAPYRQTWYCGLKILLHDGRKSCTFLLDGFPAVPDRDASVPWAGGGGRSGPTLTLFSPSSGWKLNPVVGAVYAPELYAGKLFFSSSPPSLHHLPRSDPHTSATPPPPEQESPPPLPPNQSRPERGGADKAADPGPAEPLFARRAAVKLLEEERKERRSLRAAPLQPLSDPGGCCCRWICQVRQIDFYRANRIREIERAIALAATPAEGALPSGGGNGGRR